MKYNVTQAPPGHLQTNNVLIHQDPFPDTECVAFKLVATSFLDVWCLMSKIRLSESAITKVQSPVTRTSRRNQNNVKPRPPEPQMDLQLLEMLCKENECNADEVCSI